MRYVDYLPYVQSDSTVARTTVVSILDYYLLANHIDATVVDEEINLEVPVKPQYVEILLIFVRARELFLLSARLGREFYFTRE
jgi:hypothetical protein